MGVVVAAFTMSAANLPRRTLGGTGLPVSVVGFGAAPLGGHYEDVSMLRSF